MIYFLYLCKLLHIEKGSQLNKKVLVFYLFVICIVIYFEFYSTQKIDMTGIQKPILNIDKTYIDLYRLRYDENLSLNHFWGMKDKKPKKKKIKKEKNKLKTIKKEKGKNVLCISESCYRLLGIHFEKNTPYITLYNKNIKEKIKDYKTNDILENRIKIQQIKIDEVLLKDINSSGIWKFEIFDVNKTKYKPKDINESV